MSKKGFITKLLNVAFVLQGQSPESKYYSDFDGVPFLQGNRTFGSLYPSFDTYTKKVTKLAKTGDVLMSVRAPVGALNFAPCDLCIGRGLASLRAKNGNNNFVYYALKYNIGNLIKQGSATTFDSVNKDTINDFELIIPEKENDRDKVASVLSTLDSKIEINNKINSELEVMVKTLYDYWFVQFDFPDENGKPYKSSGGEMVYNEKLKREIPEGWKVKKIGDLVNVKRGKNITRRSVIEGDIPVVAAGIEPSCYHNVANTSLPVITISGSGANAGYVQLHNQKIWASDCSYIDQTMFRQIYFMYLYLSSKQNEIYDMQKGSAQPHVYPQDIMNIKILVDKELKTIINFENLIIPMFKQIGKNKQENQKLTELRDWLLPMLMNGQVTVN